MNIVIQNFDNKFYKDEARDMYKLVEMIDWEGEMVRVKDMRKKSLMTIVLDFIASTANIFWRSIWKAKN